MRKDVYDALEEDRLRELQSEMDKHLDIPLSERCADLERRLKNRGYWFGWSLNPLYVVAAYERQSGKCAYCPWTLNYSFCIEHIRPVSRDGDNCPDNIAVSCGPCNKDKGTRTPSEWTPLLRKPRNKTVLLRKKNGQEIRKTTQLGSTPGSSMEPVREQPDTEWWVSDEDIFHDLP